MSSLANWLFGPRVIKVDCGDRVISSALSVTDMVDTDKVLEVRTDAIESCTKKTFRQEVGLIYGAKAYIEIDFDFSECESNV